ncbi:ATP-binding protein [Siphonobacter sp. SORGH_AS_0500]|uniref:ATP-binding protein n=1 Tax=Siphonobacter sp. SORGH_AS_0500 TaxID=1864824 RepID=UPI00286636E8|nr:ATP-binding protein [Siphonobacter sp. SORGH_AS_0500]MDR6197495.1 signal transduction histidine kinase [Siphonobacter sp. SORGH_AS_0500]
MTETESSEQFLAGGGEMGQLIRSMDWSKTPLGPVESWPQSLRTSVSLCLSSTFPILIAWGPETIQIYNDSYRPICGAKHPESMGQNFRICWETALPVVGDKFTRGQQGEGTYIKDQRMFLDRYGYLEESFMTFSFAPIRDESGEVGGIFHPITETTDKMLSARRTQVLRDVAAATAQAKENEDIYSSIASIQEDFSLDLPYLLFYELDSEAGKASLKQTTGLKSHYQLPEELLELDLSATEWLQDLSQTLTIENVAERLSLIEGGPYEAAPHTLIRLPIFISTKEQPVGFLLAGVSPHRAIDQDYLNFYALLANTINTAFSNVNAYQEEQKKAEALAAIDRAKTAFFSNISHEFRTPLTLMLGPLEELLRDEKVLESPYKAPVEATHRNALRLLKLVNNLLDFSRIEANRVQATYRPVDLVALTTDLSSSFRSLIERAGLTFDVHTDPMPAPVYADAEMWEKIVLNLLSNAFKYTLEGSVSVVLTTEGNQAVLHVTDTGVGIPEKELPHMFERFHRVENAGGRTYEGSGIGLSLVHELVRLHGGTIGLTSVEGQGTTFTVRIPLGKNHLPTDQIVEESSIVGISHLADSFVKEASTMLEDDKPAREGLEANSTDVDKNTQILIVDDNADMRAYLTRLLEPYFTIHTAFNGADALEKLSYSLQPDLILSDIMMPVMDGKELLEKLKKNASTAHIPLIFLSARAGQEARIDGLEAGADDYLVKPFSGQELLTKVRAQINLNQSRRQIEIRLRNLVQQAPVAMMLVKGEELTIELINQTMLSLIQRENDLIGQPLLEALPELKGQDFVERCRKVYQTGEPDQAYALEIPLLKNGMLEVRYFNLLLSPYYEGNRQTGVLEVCTEVTDIILINRALQASEARYRDLSNELDEQVQQRTKELQESVYDLQRSNEQLQQFAYIASHDLQEPLRKIQSFSTLLKLQHSEDLGDSIIYLDRMQTAAGRMSTLIRDLLSFSQITTQQISAHPVPLNEVLQTVINDLEVTIQEASAQIHVSSLPTVMGDASQLHQLFQNLLSNGIKFRKDDVYPQIHVHSKVIDHTELPTLIKPTKHTSHYYCIDVTDNGIGFDEKYLKRIFQVFQRLHGKTEFAGTGVGLAICEKVAANHGGAITAKSQLEQGSTFRVFLPK